MADHYMGALLEDIDRKIDLILEGQSTMATSAELRAVDDRLIRVETDVKLIFKIVADESTVTRKHTSTLTDHEIRITDLEDDEPQYA